MTKQFSSFTAQSSDSTLNSTLHIRTYILLTVVIAVVAANSFAQNSNSINSKWEISAGAGIFSSILMLPSINADRISNGSNYERFCGFCNVGRINPMGTVSFQVKYNVVEKGYEHSRSIIYNLTGNYVNKMLQKVYAQLIRAPMFGSQSVDYSLRWGLGSTKRSIQDNGIGIGLGLVHMLYPIKPEALVPHYPKTVNVTWANENLPQQWLMPEFVIDFNRYWGFNPFSVRLTVAHGLRFLIFGVDSTAIDKLPKYASLTGVWRVW